MDKNIFKKLNIFYEKYIIPLKKELGETYFWVGGGAIVDFLLFEKITNDIDVYFLPKENRKKIENSFLEKNYKLIKKDKLTTTVIKNNLKYDLVFIYKNPIEHLKRIDIIVSGIIIDRENKIYLINEWEDNFNNRVIKIKNIIFPVGTFLRIIRYSKKGFTFDENYLIPLLETILRDALLDADDEKIKNCLENLANKKGRVAEWFKATDC